MRAGTWPSGNQGQFQTAAEHPELLSVKSRKQMLNFEQRTSPSFGCRRSGTEPWHQFRLSENLSMASTVHAGATVLPTAVSLGGWQPLVPQFFVTKAHAQAEPNTVPLPKWESRSAKFIKDHTSLESSEGLSVF